VIGREPMPMIVDYAKAITVHHVELLMVATESVGVLETIRRDDHLWIENVAVRPDRQGLGFGRCLLAHAEKTAAQMNYAKLCLLTNAAFGSSVILYEKAGYTADRTEPFRGGVTVYMSKTLNHESET